MAEEAVRYFTLEEANATLPYGLDIANKGFAQAVADSEGLREGVNTYAGHITCAPVAASGRGRLVRPCGSLGLEQAAKNSRAHAPAQTGKIPVVEVAVDRSSMTALSPRALQYV